MPLASGEPFLFPSARSIALLRCLFATRGQACSQAGTPELPVLILRQSTAGELVESSRAAICSTNCYIAYYGHE